MPEIFGSLSLEAIVIIVVALTLGSAAKGIAGFGLPVVAIPLLAAFWGVDAAVAILAFPNIVTNSILMWVHRRHATLKGGLPWFLALGVVGVVLGTWFLAELPGRALIKILAVWVALYLIMLLRHPELKMPERVARRLAPLAGLAGGALQGAMGISLPIVIPFLHSLRLNQRSYLFSVAAVFWVLSVTQIVALREFGLFGGARPLESLIAIVPIAIGMPVGIYLSKRVSQQTFDRVLIGIFMIVEIRLIYEGFFNTG